MKRILALLEHALTMPKRWLGVAAGVIVWILWMIFGLWATILLVVLAAVGFVVGLVFEANQSWKQVVEKLLSERYRD